jgi:hypothetical protein
MAALSCRSASGSWSLLRVGAGLWSLRCPVGAESAAAARLGALGLSVLSFGGGVCLFLCSRASLPGLRRVAAGVRSAV